MSIPTLTPQYKIRAQHFFFLTFIDKTHITVAKFKTKRKYITILQSHAEWIEIT